MHCVYLGAIALSAVLSATSAVAQSFVDSDLDSHSGMSRDCARNRLSNLGSTGRPSDTYTIPQVMHRSSNFGFSGPRHSGGRRAGR